MLRMCALVDETMDRHHILSVDIFGRASCSRRPSCAPTARGITFYGIRPGRSAGLPCVPNRRFGGLVQGRAACTPLANSMQERGVSRGCLSHQVVQMSAADTRTERRNPAGVVPINVARQLLQTAACSSPRTCVAHRLAARTKDNTCEPPIVSG